MHSRERFVTEFATASDGVPLAFERVGEGPPVVLVHGFGSSRHQNWKSTGWYGSLTEAGFGVVAMDCRGHGESDKPHDPAFYGHDRMAEDVAHGDGCGGPDSRAGGRLFDGRLYRRCGWRRIIPSGSAGWRWAGWANLSARPAHRRSGFAQRPGAMRCWRRRQGQHHRRAPACFAISPTSRARTGWRWPPACGRCRQGLPLETLASMPQPVLVVCGESDDVAGAPGPLAAAFPHGAAVTIAGPRSHVGGGRTQDAPGGDRISLAPRRISESRAATHAHAAVACLGDLIA